jgi:hypothetical protein
VKIGAEQASFTEIRRFGTAKWLYIPCGWEKIVENGPQQFIDAMNNKSNGKSRLIFGVTGSESTESKGPVIHRPNQEGAL